MLPASFPCFPFLSFSFFETMFKGKSFAYIYSILLTYIYKKIIIIIIRCFLFLGASSSLNSRAPEEQDFMITVYMLHLQRLRQYRILEKTKKS